MTTAHEDSFRQVLRGAIKYVSEPATREILQQDGVQPTAPVIACRWETTFAEVRRMVETRAVQGKAIIVVMKSDEPHLIVASAEEFSPERLQVPSNTIDDASEMGMLVDTLDARSNTYKLDGAEVERSFGFSLKSLTPA